MCSNEFIGNKEYFNNLIDCMDNYYQEFYNYLLNLDVSNWNMNDLFDSELRNELVEDSLSLPKLFMDDLLNNNIELCNDFGDYELKNNKLKIRKQDLYNIFNSWKFRNGYNSNAYNIRSFSKELKNMDYDTKTIKVNNKVIKGYYISLNEN